jgi:TolA-binding protein
VFFSRKRKSGEADVEHQQPTVTPRITMQSQVSPKSAAEGANIKPIPTTDEQIEHARSKIAELERQLEETQLRSTAALKRVEEFKRQEKSRGSLQKKLDSLRLYSLWCLRNLSCLWESPAPVSHMLVSPQG